MTEPDIIEAIIKELPIRAAYKDAVRPAARQAGELGEDLLKTLRLALFPLQFAGAAQDRLKKFIKSSVERVPLDRRVAPAPQIAGPVFEGIRYEPEGTSVERMFSELLSTAMDEKRLGDAHPSFPQIVRQLSGDEAKVLAHIAANPGRVKHTQKFRITGALTHAGTEADDLESIGLAYPKNAGLYREHLERLGLIRLEALSPLEPIFAGTTQIGGRNRYFYNFSEFGEAFIRAANPA